MTIKVGLHGDRYDAEVKEYFDGESPFVTFEIVSTDMRTDYYSRLEDGTYRVNKNQTGSVTVFVRNAEDAYRILAAANELIRSIENLEFEKTLKETLKEDIESFFNPEDL